MRVKIEIKDDDNNILDEFYIGEGFRGDEMDDMPVTVPYYKMGWDTCAYPMFEKVRRALDREAVYAAREAIESSSRMND